VPAAKALLQEHESNTAPCPCTPDWIDCLELKGGLPRAQDPTCGALSSALHAQAPSDPKIPKERELCGTGYACLQTLSGAQSDPVLEGTQKSASPPVLIAWPVISAHLWHPWRTQDDDDVCDSSPTDARLRCVRDEISLQRRDRRSCHGGTSTRRMVGLQSTGRSLCRISRATPAAARRE